MENALVVKRNKFLDSQVNYRGVVLTRRAMIALLLNEGRKPIKETIFNLNEFNKATERLAFINKRYYIGLSNPNIPEVKEGIALKERLSDRKNFNTKIEYVLRSADDSSELNITKTEYDLALTINQGSK